MPGATWRGRVDYARDGEPTSAGTVGRPDLDLSLRTEYLKARIDTAELGESVLTQPILCDPALAVGEAVYWDDARSRFGRAMLAVARDPLTGLMDAAPSAQVVGICAAKLDAADTAIIALGGRIRQAPATTAAAAPGRYFLSSSDPGKLTPTRPAAGLPVLFYDGQWSYIHPQPQGVLDSHVHLAFDLVCRPAGVATLIDHIHHIADPDPNLSGWLPATHPVFGGRAPAGAVFGYNLDRHLDLKAVWPPVPIDSTRLYWDYARTLGGALLVPSGPNGAYIADEHGLWWLSSCYGDVPWPEPPDLVPPALEGSSFGFGRCPREEVMRLVLTCVDSAGAGSLAVRSLRPAPGSMVQVRDDRGDPATHGDLVVDVDWGGTITFDPTLAIGRAVKDLGPSGHLLAGPTVSGVSAGSRVVLSGGDVFTAGDTTYRRGLVTISAQVGDLPRELSLQLVRLQDAEEGFIETLGIPFLSLPPGRDSSFIARFDVPPAEFPGPVAMVLRGLIYSGASGTLPAVTAAVRVIPRPDASGVVLASTSSEVWTFPTAGVAITGGQAKEVATPTALPVTPGATVMVRIGRGVGDGFAGEVGLLRLAVVLQAI